MVLRMLLRLRVVRNRIRCIRRCVRSLGVRMLLLLVLFVAGWGIVLRMRISRVLRFISLRCRVILR